MTELPPGEWSALLVGDQWPGPAAQTLSGAVQRRRELGAALERYAEELRSVRDTHLAPQQGIAAEALRDLFSRGEQAVRDRAGSNNVKAAAYDRARQCLDQLRTDLTEIAADGNARIEAVNRSDAPAAGKVGQIVDVIAAARAAAAAKVAAHADTVYAAIQSVLDTQGGDGSARTFAATHGVPADVHRPGTDLDALHRAVTDRR